MRRPFFRLGDPSSFWVPCSKTISLGGISAWIGGGLRMSHSVGVAALPASAAAPAANASLRWRPRRRRLPPRTCAVRLRTHAQSALRTHAHCVYSASSVYKHKHECNGALARGVTCGHVVCMTVNLYVWVTHPECVFEIRGHLAMRKNRIALVPMSFEAKDRLCTSSLPVRAS